MIHIAVALLIASIAGSGPAPAQSHADYRARQHETQYHGPGRDEVLPESVSAIRIGYFGPSDSQHPEGGDAWLAACLAIQELNREGGYRGVPFRLYPGWSESPWGTGIATVTRRVYDDRVLAFIGSIDGASTHLVEQVVAKARLTLVNPASTDKTINLANVPWMFSCLPGEHLQVPPLLRALRKRLPGNRLTILSSTDHDSRVFVHELLQGLSECQISPTFHFQFRDLRSDPLDFLDAARSSEAVVVVAGAADSALLVDALRKAGFQGPVFGTASMGRRAFLESLPPNPGILIFPLIARIPTPAFVRKYTDFAGRAPDYIALQTYDAVYMIAVATRRAGPNRALIRDEIRGMAPWTGEAGLVDWDPLGHNRRAVQLATIRDGRLGPLED